MVGVWLRELAYVIFQGRENPRVYFENVIFKDVGQNIVQSGSLMTYQNIMLHILNCSFTIGYNMIPPSWNLIQIRIGEFIGIDITIDLKDATPLLSHVSIFSIGVATLKNLRILCPKMYGMKKPEFLESMTLSHVSCEKYCEEDQYSLQHGEAVLYENTDYSYIYSDMVGEPSVFNTTDPTCFPCPIGAQCGHTITSLPDYWGYKNDSGYITMIRCPDGYCCTDNETCIGIDSCATGRTGTLCGNCEPNFTESMLSQSCVSTENCSDSLTIALYILCAMCYAVALLVANKIKQTLVRFVKVLKTLFQKLKSAKNTAESPNIKLVSNFGKQSKRSPDVQSISYGISEGQPTDSRRNDRIKRSIIGDVKKEIKDHEDGGIKYMQILFYYVQDSSLFQINLSNNAKNENVLVKILHFSPDILADVYQGVNELCLSSGSALTKCFFKTLFGTCVILIICVICLIQIALSRFLWKQSTILTNLKGASTQAFLLSLLFSFQRLATGAFILIQCIQVHNSNVLYIQGEIACYTWWQNVIQAYIWLSIVPFFLVVSHCPYHVKDKKMSTAQFIFACFFPIPVILYYLFVKLKDYLNKTSNSSYKDKGKGTKWLRVLELINQRRRKQVDIELSSEIENMGTVSVETETDSVQTVSMTALYTVSEEEIIRSLLRHYKCLKVFGIRFTWLGIHKLYRLILVACHTYITEPLYRLYIMTGLLVGIYVVSTLIKPYKDRRANVTSALSYTANVVIAIINIGKVGMLTFDCKTNCPLQSVFADFLGTIENILLVYIPFVAITAWLMGSIVHKCRSKKKEIE